MPSHLWLPRRYVERPKPTAIVFWYSEKRNRILVGAPEQYPIPEALRAEGYNKIVCRSAQEVAIWSQKLRDQERRDREIEESQREAIEGPIRDALRADLIHGRDHARNSINREAMERAIQHDDEYQRRRESEQRTSFQHCEGFEEGH